MLAAVRARGLPLRSLHAPRFLSDVTQDEGKKAEAEIQKLTDKYIKSIDELLVVKEKEVMEV